MSKFDFIKSFINSHDNFTRQDIMKEIKVMNPGIKHICGTYDQYIVKIYHVGFIKRIDEGSYIRLCKLPDYITSAKISKVAYKEKEKQELMLPLLRKEKLDKIKKSGK